MTSLLAQRIQAEIDEASSLVEGTADYHQLGGPEGDYVAALHEALRLVRSTPQLVVVVVDAVGDLDTIWASMPATAVVLTAEGSAREQEVNGAGSVNSGDFKDIAALPEWAEINAKLAAKGLTLADFLVSRGNG